MLKRFPTYRRFVALGLACLMFFTASGMNLDVHFCGGNIASLSLFGQAESCHDKAMQHQKSCCATKVEAKPIKQCHQGCCDDASFLLLKMDGDLIPAHFAKADKSVEFVIRQFFAFPKPKLESLRLSSFQNYIPPLLDYDIPVLVQSFLL